MVGDVVFAGNVFNAKVSLKNPICEPEISHVHTLRPLLVEFVVREAQCNGVVDAEQSWRLGLPEVSQGVAMLHSTLGCHESRSQFGLGHGRNNAVDHFAGIIDRTVDGVGFPKVPEPTSD
jgi:hypothetical protein